MPTKTSAEILAWKSEIHQALSSSVPMAESVVKDLVAHFTQSDGAQVFPRPSSTSAMVLVAQLANTKGLDDQQQFASGSNSNDQSVINTCQLLTTIFLDVNIGCDILGRVAVPIANQAALHLISYLTATIPTTAAPNTQDEEAIFTNNPFSSSNKMSSSGGLSAGFSSVARANHVYHRNPRLAAVQTLLVLTRRFQLAAPTAKEITALAERQVVSYLALCQLFGDAADVEGRHANASFGSSTRGRSTFQNMGGHADGNRGFNNTNGPNALSYSSSGPSAALTTYMTMQHHATLLSILCFSNICGSWGTNVFSAAVAGGAVSLVPNPLAKNEQLGRDTSLWVSALHTKITDSANQHLDAISASLAASNNSNINGHHNASFQQSKSHEAQERARASIVKYVDGFVSIITLIVGLLSVSQGDLAGLDRIIEAFRGDRRELNAPDVRSGDTLKTFAFRGKVAERLVDFCPAPSRLRLPSWFIPEIYFDLLNALTADEALPALKHLSDLDVESCRVYNAALEEVAAQRHQQQLYQQGLAASVGGGQGAATVMIRTGSALTGAPATTTTVQTPRVTCYPYTSAMASICEAIAFVFTVLPSSYLRADIGGPGSPADRDEDTIVISAETTDEELFAAEDNNISTFVFRNYIYHLKELYEVSGRSGIDNGYGSGVSATGLFGGNDQNAAAGLWDVFALRASAAYARLLAQLASVDATVAARIFATVLGESQADCVELQWVNLLRQVRLALTVVPTGGGANTMLTSGGGIGGGNFYGPLGLAGGSDPYANSSSGLRSTNGAPASPQSELSAKVAYQSSAHALVAAQQAFATNTLLLIANVTARTSAPSSTSTSLFARRYPQLEQALNSSIAAASSAILKAIPPEAVLSLIDSKLLSPDALGAVLTATAALMTTPEQRKNCWLIFEQKGLLRTSSTPIAGGQGRNGQTSGGSQQGGGEGWIALSTVVTDSEINSLPGHCLREARAGTYPITISFIRLLLKFIAVPTIAPSASSSSAVGGAASTESMTILTSASFRSLLRFVADDIVCALGRRVYTNEDEHYEIAALATELLNDALLTFGPNTSELTAPTQQQGIAANPLAASSSSSSSSSTHAAFHTLMATGRAPNDVLAQILAFINEAVADLAADHPISVTRMCALRSSTRLLYTAMYAIKIDRALTDAVYTFNARTYDNTEFIAAILRLCCSAAVALDGRIARRCFAILGLIDKVMMSTTLRMILSPTGAHNDLCVTARYVLASLIDNATDSVASSAAASGVISNATDNLGLSFHLQSLDVDPLAEADVPSTAGALLDLMVRNASLPCLSLTSWLCGYDLGAETITWDGGCLEVVIAKLNDSEFRSNPATAPLATKCIQLIYALLCNPTTATNQFHSILASRGNHSFLRTVHAIALGSSAGLGNSEESFGVSPYDSISTEQQGITLHELDFAGYAFRILSIHLHRLSQKSLVDRRTAVLADRAEHEFDGVTLHSTRLGASMSGLGENGIGLFSGGLGARNPNISSISSGKFTSDAARVGGTSVMATSHDPLIAHLRKMVRLFRHRGTASTHNYRSGIVDSDFSDSDAVLGAASSLAFGRRMLEVLERLPPYPVLAVPGGATDAFIVQTAQRIPQYSIPALSVAFANYGPHASLGEIRENLRIFVFANSCLIAYNAAATYIRGWCELLEVVCANTHAVELSLEKLVTLAEEIIAAIAITDKLTIAAQQEIVVSLSQALLAITIKMSEVRVSGGGLFGTAEAEAESAWAEEGLHSLQSLLTAVVRSLVRFRDVSAPSRLSLYNVIRVLISLAPLRIEPALQAEDREAVMDVVVSDICSPNPATLAEGVLLAPDTSAELVALHSLRRFLQVPDTLTYFAVSARSTVSIANTLNNQKNMNTSSGSSMNISTNNPNDTTFLGGGGVTSGPSSSSMFGTNSSKPPAAVETFWSPSARLVSVVKAIFRTINSSCCALFSGGGNAYAHAAFLLEYLDSSSDILALIARNVPHVLYSSGAVEAAFMMRCWDLVSRALNNQGNVAAITARHLAESGAASMVPSVAPQQQQLPPHVVRLFSDVGVRLMASTLSWVNALFESKRIRGHLTLVGSSTHFLRLHLPLFQAILKTGSACAKNAASVAAGVGGGAHQPQPGDEIVITPIRTSQLRLIEEVSIFLAMLSGTQIANECRSLIQLLGLTDLLMSFTAPEMLTHAFFVDDEVEEAIAVANGGVPAAPSPPSVNPNPSPFVQLPIGSITRTQLGHVSRTTRNLTSFLLNTVHPILQKMKQKEAETISKLPKIPTAANGSNLSNYALPASNVNSAKPSAAQSAEAVWPLLEPAFMTALSVLLHQLNIAVATTVNWEIRSASSVGGASTTSWHSKVYLDAATSVVLLAHSAILQCLLMRKDQPHVFAATSTDANAKALTFHTQHLASALNNTLQALTDAQHAVLASSASPSSVTSNPAMVAGAYLPHQQQRSALAGGSGELSGAGSSSSLAPPASLADALGGIAEVGMMGGSFSASGIVKSRLTGGAAYDGRGGELDDEVSANNTNNSRKRSPLMVQLSHAGTMTLYQGVQKTRSLVIAACRDAEKLFNNEGV